MANMIRLKRINGEVFASINDLRLSIFDTVSKFKKEGGHDNIVKAQTLEAVEETLSELKQYA